MSDQTNTPQTPGDQPAADPILDQALADYRETLRQQRAPELVGARIARAAAHKGTARRVGALGTKRWLPAGLAAAVALTAVVGLFTWRDSTTALAPLPVTAGVESTEGIERTATPPAPMRLSVSYEPVPVRRLTPTGGHQIYYVNSRILRDERGLVRAVFPSRRTDSQRYGARPASLP